MKNDFHYRVVKNTNIYKLITINFYMPLENNLEDIIKNNLIDAIEIFKKEDYFASLNKINNILSIYKEKNIPENKNLLDFHSNVEDKLLEKTEKTYKINKELLNLLMVVNEGESTLQYKQIFKDFREISSYINIISDKKTNQIKKEAKDYLNEKTNVFIKKLNYEKAIKLTELITLIDKEDKKYISLLKSYKNKKEKFDRFSKKLEKLEILNKEEKYNQAIDLLNENKKDYIFFHDEKSFDESINTFKLKKKSFFLKNIDNEKTIFKSLLSEKTKEYSFDELNTINEKIDLSLEYFHTMIKIPEPKSENSFNLGIDSGSGWYDFFLDSKNNFDFQYNFYNKYGKKIFDKQKFIDEKLISEKLIFNKESDEKYTLLFSSQYQGVYNNLKNEKKYFSGSNAIRPGANYLFWFKTYSKKQIPFIFQKTIEDIKKQKTDFLENIFSYEFKNNFIRSYENNNKEKHEITNNIKDIKYKIIPKNIFKNNNLKVYLGVKNHIVEEFDYTKNNKN